jgi:hypothetical protein
MLFLGMTILGLRSWLAAYRTRQQTTPGPAATALASDGQPVAV